MDVKVDYLLQINACGLLLSVAHCKIAISQKQFASEGVWNTLPENVVDFSSRSVFRCSIIDTDDFSRFLSCS